MFAVILLPVDLMVERLILIDSSVIFLTGINLLSKKKIPVKKEIYMIINMVRTIDFRLVHFRFFITLSMYGSFFII